MKLWHGLLLGLGLIMVVGGTLIAVFPNITLPNISLDNPQYAPGEACAMVERVYHWRSNSDDLYSPLSEEYLGHGVWQVESSSWYNFPPLMSLTHKLPINSAPAIFRVYEKTDTVEIWNDVARYVLNRRTELE